MKASNFLSKIVIAILITGAAFLISCEKEYITDIEEPIAVVTNKAVSLTETFESGTKTSYAGAAVTLSTGSWYLTDALLGTSTSEIGRAHV